MLILFASAVCLSRLSVLAKHCYALLIISFSRILSTCTLFILSFLFKNVLFRKMAAMQQVYFPPKYMVMKQYQKQWLNNGFQSLGLSQMIKVLQHIFRMELVYLKMYSNYTKQIV